MSVRSEPSYVPCACGALYERVSVTLPIKDIGVFDCFECGTRLEIWHGRTVPVFNRLEGVRSLRRPLAH